VVGANIVSSDRGGAGGVSVEGAQKVVGKGVWIDRVRGPSFSWKTALVGQSWCRGAEVGHGLRGNVCPTMNTRTWGKREPTLEHTIVKEERELASPSIRETKASGKA